MGPLCNDERISSALRLVVVEGDRRVCWTQALGLVQRLTPIRCVEGKELDQDEHEDACAYEEQLGR